MNTNQMVEELTTLIVDNESEIAYVQTFKEVGLLTNDDGLIVTVEDDSQFKLTIVKTK